ncbi:hypothetical protein ES705_46648 [subsurface metagenome]
MTHVIKDRFGKACFTHGSSHLLQIIRNFLYVVLMMWFVIDLESKDIRILLIAQSCVLVHMIQEAFHVPLLRGNCLGRMMGDIPILRPLP